MLRPTMLRAFHTTICHVFHASNENLKVVDLLVAPMAFVGRVVVTPISSVLAPPLIAIMFIWHGGLGPVMPIKI